MVVAGATILFFGIGWIARGAVPRDVRDVEADRGMVRGAVLLPAGLALMVTGSPHGAGGIPHWALSLLVVLAVVLAVWIVYTMSEEQAPARRVAELEPAVRVPVWVPGRPLVMRLIGRRF